MVGPRKHGGTLELQMRSRALKYQSPTVFTTNYQLFAIMSIFAHRYRQNWLLLQPSGKLVLEASLYAWSSKFCDSRFRSRRFRVVACPISSCLFRFRLVSFSHQMHRKQNTEKKHSAKGRGNAPAFVQGRRGVENENLVPGTKQKLTGAAKRTIKRVSSPNVLSHCVQPLAHPPTHPPTYPPTYPPTFLPPNPPTHLPTHPPTHPSPHPPSYIPPTPPPASRISFKTAPPFVKNFSKGIHGVAIKTEGTQKV